jgi:hypothetical protein
VPPADPHSSPRLRLAVLTTALAFAAAYSQAPLYYSNQNQYFLHGLAWAGHGYLHDDWLANTLDPTPVFTALVAFTVRFLHPWFFHVYHALLLGGCAAALFGVFEFLVGRETAARRWPVFALLLVLVHSAALRWACYRLLGQDYVWFFQAGVAGQYVLGGFFQPSVFGVLLVVAVCLFARGRPFAAGACVAATATLHPTYLLHGALLTVGFLVVLLWERRLRTALAVGAMTLALVVPIALCSAIVFRPTSPGEFAAAEDVLVNLRIPHHTRPDLWLDGVAVVQIVWMLLGVALTWRTRLFGALAVPLLLAVVLTLVQVATGSRALALLFPWRFSAVLMPVATAVVLARLTALPSLPLDNFVARWLSLLGLGGVAAAGLWISLAQWGFYSADEELPVMNFVRQTKSPGDLYFLPVRVPNLAGTTRGSVNGDFKPLPAKRGDARLIPVDMQRFRIHTGAPLFVDFKSIPYRDTDVIEWRDRVRQGEAVRESLERGEVSAALDVLRSRGVTHLIVPAAQEPSALGIREVYADEYYLVYRVEVAR